MRNQQLYCAACEKQVRVLISETPVGEHQATVHDDEVICLDVSERCTGECPLGATEPDAMVGRMLHEGLSTDTMHTVNATCPTCGLPSEFALYGQGKATCTLCGTHVRWVAEHVEPM